MFLYLAVRRLLSAVSRRVLHVIREIAVLRGDEKLAHIRPKEDGDGRRVGHHNFPHLFQGEKFSLNIFHCIL